jgi:hypothetical protein
MQKGLLGVGTAPQNHLNTAVVAAPSLPAFDNFVLDLTATPWLMVRAGEECVLDVGDHAWIQKKSFLSFRDAMLIDAKKAASIQGLVGTLVAMHPPLSAIILNKIVNSAKISRSIPQTLKAFLNTC